MMPVPISVLVMVSIAMTKHQDQKSKLGRRGKVFFDLNFHSIVHHQRKSEQELKQEITRLDARKQEVGCESGVPSFPYCGFRCRSFSIASLALYSSREKVGRGQRMSQKAQNLSPLGICCLIPPPRGRAGVRVGSAGLCGQSVS